MYAKLFRGCSVLALAVHSVLAAADPASTSSYFTDPQSSHVQDATSRGIGQVSFITCLMAAMRPDALVNKGSYVALIDGNKCDPEAQASGDAVAPAFKTAIIDSTRVSNDDPMIAHIWLEEEDEGRKSNIAVRVSATEPPTSTNAYGVFRLDYCGAAEGSEAAGCQNNGYLEGSSSGIRYYEKEMRDAGDPPSIKAVNLTASGTTSGAGSMSIDGDHGGGTAAFNFAYNETLFRRAEGTDDQCFSRDATDPDTGISVWRYGLYDATSGERITRSSGFPIEYTAGGETYRGYLGYGGLSLPGSALSSMTTGSTVQKVDYANGGEPTRTNYTVVKSEGKLTKYTRQERTLHDIDQVKFSTFVGNDVTGFYAGATANTNYEMYWDDAAGNFKVVSKSQCDMNGCSTQAVAGTPSVSPSFWHNRNGVQGFSNTLGGEVFIELAGATTVADSDEVSVVYRVQDLVYPSAMPADLYCVRDCLTSASMQSYFSQGSADASPYASGTFNNFSPAVAGAVVHYHTDSATAMLKDSSNASVAFTDAEALERSNQYRNGIRGGKLFANLAAAECSTGSQTYCDLKVNELDVYYQWETGPNPYNQFAAVKNAGGTFVTFDAPLQVGYHVPAESKYGEYAGQNIVLQYGGFGELWGIPGYCVSQSSNAIVSCEGDGDGKRYVAAFAIPFDTTTGRVSDGTHTYLVKWLDREIRFANKNVSVCDAAGLQPPSGVALPTAAELRNPNDASSTYYIGPKPVVEGAPRVVHGEVKY
jgi:hypothetical protein